MGVNDYCIFDITRAREDLGFATRYSFEEGVRDCIETMRRLGLEPAATA